MADIKQHGDMSFFFIHEASLSKEVRRQSKALRGLQNDAFHWRSTVHEQWQCGEPHTKKGECLDNIWYVYDDTFYDLHYANKKARCVTFDSIDDIAFKPREEWKIYMSFQDWYQYVLSVDFTAFPGPYSIWDNYLLLAKYMEQHR